MVRETETNSCSECHHPHGAHAPTCSRHPRNIEKGADTTGTDRSLAEYEEFTGIDFSQKKGDLVLDLGSGEKQSFAKEAAKKGVDVVSLSLDLAEEKYRSLLKKGLAEKIKDTLSLKKSKEMAAASKIQEMPFADNAFEAEVGIYSFTNYYHLPENRDDYTQTIGEVIRTLKPGGKAVFYPVHSEDYNNPMLEEIFSQFKGQADIYIEPLPNEQEEMELGKKEFEDRYTKLSPTSPEYAERLEKFMKVYILRRLVIEKKP